MIRRFPTTINVANNPKHKHHPMFHEVNFITEGNGSGDSSSLDLICEEKQIVLLNRYYARAET